MKEYMSIILIGLVLITSCKEEEPMVPNDPTEMPDAPAEIPDAPTEISNDTTEISAYQPLTDRPGPRTETTSGVPHHQIGVEPVLEVLEELRRRVYSIPGIEERPSVVLSWQGLSLEENLSLVNPGAVISGRELGHIHDDGSLHIFLDPERASEAVASAWAIDHPFAVQGQEGWEGFVMLYTPLSIEELDVTFQLIVDGYNFVTGQNLIATDYH